MCLDNFTVDDYIFHGKKTRIAYKVMLKDGKAYHTPWHGKDKLFSAKDLTTKELISDRNSIKLTSWEDGFRKIDNGIHVCLSLKEAKRLGEYATWQFSGNPVTKAVIVRCIARKEDYVAHNYGEDPSKDDLKHGVFMKVKFVGKVVTKRKRTKNVSQ
jgi:hypothetical protein